SPSGGSILIEIVAFIMGAILMRAHPMKRPIRFIVVAIAVLGALALASYLTTASDWDGGFPAGEFRLNIRNTNGQPVKGAILRVYHGGTRGDAFEYPLNNYLSDQMPVSDDNGRMIALQQHRGLQFGGFSWDLFWIIPIGAKPPKYDCEITADGYRPLGF